MKKNLLLGTILCFFIFSSALSADSIDNTTFLRGINYSHWYIPSSSEKDGWVWSDEIVSKDITLLKNLHINAIKVYDTPSTQHINTFTQEGIRVIPQIINMDRISSVPKMSFANGQQGSEVAYAQDSVKNAFYEEAKRVAEYYQNQEGIPMINLGNEYTWKGFLNNNQEYLGFDAATLALFREWLQKKFQNDFESFRIQIKSDETFSDFSEVLPPSTFNKTLLAWEWWNFHHQQYREFLASGKKGIQEILPHLSVFNAIKTGPKDDAASPFADTGDLNFQGQNVYYAFSRWWHNLRDTTDENFVDYQWYAFGTSLSRAIGPGYPTIVTETGVNTKPEDVNSNPDSQYRLMKQNLWSIILHPEVKGIFLYHFQDIWTRSGESDVRDGFEDFWGIFDANRNPKPSAQAVRETYAEFEKLESFLNTRSYISLDLLVSDQSAGFWNTNDTPYLPEISKYLYQQGVNFHYISLLDGNDLAKTTGKKLLLIDSLIINTPNGSSPSYDALQNFANKGGEVLYISKTPWKTLYGNDLAPIAGVTVITPGSPSENKKILENFLFSSSKKNRARVFSQDPKSNIMWRILISQGKEYLLVVSADEDQRLEEIKIQGVEVEKIISSDGAILSNNCSSDHMGRNIPTFSLQNFDTYALLEIHTQPLSNTAPIFLDTPRSNISSLKEGARTEILFSANDEEGNLFCPTWITKEGTVTQEKGRNIYASEKGEGKRDTQIQVILTDSYGLSSEEEFLISLIPHKILTSYDGYFSESIKQCLKNTPENNNPSEKITAQYSYISFSQTREEIFHDIQSVFGHAVQNKQIDWQWSDSLQEYTFFTAPNDENFWICYFQTESLFFNDFFDDISIP